MAYCSHKIESAPLVAPTIGTPENRRSDPPPIQVRRLCCRHGLPEQTARLIAELLFGVAK